MSPRPFCWLLSLASLAGCYVLVADDPRIRATVRANAAFVHDLGLLSEEVDGAMAGDGAVAVIPGPPLS
jgi:hypothetical protein